MRRLGRKSRLPPRVPGTGKLPKVELPRLGKRFRGYIDFLTPEVTAMLRRAGWRKRSKGRVASGGEIFAEAVSAHTVATQLWWAFREYAVACAYAVDPKRFRQELLALEQPLNSLIAKIPTADSALTLAIDQEVREILHCQSADFEKEEEDAIRDQAEFDNLKLVLTTISQAVKNIRSIEQGRGREARRPAHQFVAELARIFTECTGRQPGRNNDGSRDGVDAVTGPFGNFVKAVNCQIPKALQLVNIDNLIRHEVSRRRWV
jgi:hypothetical protein